MSENDRQIFSISVKERQALLDYLRSDDNKEKGTLEQLKETPQELLDLEELARDLQPII